MTLARYLRRLGLLLAILLADPWLAGAQIVTNGTTTQTRYTLGQSRLPMILPSSGSMGNNGALTLTTALDQAYPNAYFYMPANAIVAGSTAGFYYGTMSSTTAVTLFNNPYVSGTPTIPASPTAFVTTGPGAYTQTTGAGFTAFTIAIPGKTLGVNDEISAHGLASYPNSAGAKTITLNFGAFTFGSLGMTTSAELAFQGGFANAGVTNRQNLTGQLVMGLSTNGSVPTNGAVDTTANQNLTVGLRLATATDYIILQSVVFERIPAASN